MSAASEYDVLVIGAGHNGLAASALLAGRGLRVLCLEKNGYVGGMAGTREILTGCRNDVGASLLFPLAKGIETQLELARYGVEFIDLPIMASNLNSKRFPASHLLLEPFAHGVPCAAPLRCACHARASCASWRSASIRRA